MTKDLLNRTVVKKIYDGWIFIVSDEIHISFRHHAGDMKKIISGPGFQLALLHSVSYFFFLYRSPSSPSCSVLDAVSTNIDRALSKHPTANVFVFGDFNVHHVEWLKHLHGTDQPGEYSFNFSITHNFTQIVDFPTCIPDCDTHRPALLDLFLTSDPGLCSLKSFCSSW